MKYISWVRVPWAVYIVSHHLTSLVGTLPSSFVDIFCLHYDYDCDCLHRLLDSAIATGLILDLFCPAAIVPDFASLCHRARNRHASPRLSPRRSSQPARPRLAHSPKSASRFQVGDIFHSTIMHEEDLLGEMRPLPTLAYSCARSATSPSVPRRFPAHELVPNCAYASSIHGHEPSTKIKVPAALLLLSEARPVLMDLGREGPVTRTRVPCREGDLPGIITRARCIPYIYIH